MLAKQRKEDDSVFRGKPLFYAPSFFRRGTIQKTKKTRKTRQNQRNWADFYYF